jgi:hypothetical protein
MAQINPGKPGRTLWFEDLFFRFPWSLFRAIAQILGEMHNEQQGPISVASDSFQNKFN